MLASIDHSHHIPLEMVAVDDQHNQPSQVLVEHTSHLVGDLGSHATCLVEGKESIVREDRLDSKLRLKDL